jgi:hypothetical protein
MASNAASSHKSPDQISFSINHFAQNFVTFRYKHNIEISVALNHKFHARRNIMLWRRKKEREKWTRSCAWNSSSLSSLCFYSAESPWDYVTTSERRKFGEKFCACKVGNESISFFLSLFHLLRPLLVCYVTGKIAMVIKKWKIKCLIEDRFAC